jgi:hypothetical protein
MHSGEGMAGCCPPGSAGAPPSARAPVVRKPTPAASVGANFSSDSNILKTGLKAYLTSGPKPK